jgi:stage II sporulation protein D
VQVREGGRGRTVSLQVEEYVRGAILGEAAVSRDDAALATSVFSLQAILARTYAVRNRGRHADEGFDLCDQTHCQVFRRDDGQHPEWRRQAAADAVARTAGQVIVHQGRPIQAVFHALCGGHTRDADAVWGGASVPYLRGVPDPFCLNASGAAWTYRMTASALGDALNRQDATRVGRLSRLVPASADTASAPAMVRIEGSSTKTVRSEVLRAAINASQGPTAVRSPSFSFRREGEVWVFQGRGNGHGVGVCQIGALARLRAGARLNDVLAAYYPGTTLDRLS